MILHAIELAVGAVVWVSMSGGTFYLGSLLHPPIEDGGREIPTMNVRRHQLGCLIAPPIMLAYYAVKICGMAAQLRYEKIEQRAIAEARERQATTKYLAAANKEVERLLKN